MIVFSSVVSVFFCVPHPHASHHHQPHHHHRCSTTTSSATPTTPHSSWSTQRTPGSPSGTVQHLCSLAGVDSALLLSFSSLYLLAYSFHPLSIMLNASVRPWVMYGIESAVPSVVSYPPGSGWLRFTGSPMIVFIARSYSDPYGLGACRCACYRFLLCFASLTFLATFRSAFICLSTLIQC